MRNLLELPNHFDKEIWKVLDHLFTHSFFVTLVGGATRDFVMKGEFSKDLDFEIRHKNCYENKEWEEKLIEFFTELSRDFNVEKLSYNVYKVKLQEVELEFSSPRIEIFKHDDITHSNFDCLFFSELEYSKAFKRRDFTCNAIGLELKSRELSELKIIDPFGGLSDIENKRLNYCSHDFSLDPVRFLRAIRFHKKMGFEIVPTLNEAMKKMNLEKLSSYYFFSEFHKSLAPDFFKVFFDYIDNFGLILSKTLSSLSFLQKINLKNIVNERELFILAIYQDLIQKEEAMEVCSLFGIKKKYAQQLFLFLSGLKRIDQTFLKTIKEQDFQVVKNIPDFLFAHSVVNFINTNSEIASSIMALVDKSILLGEIEREKETIINSEHHLMQSYLRLKGAAIVS